MAIYRVMYYSTVTVGSGGRITIPQDMRDDLGIDEAQREVLEAGARIIPRRAAWGGLRWRAVRCVRDGTALDAALRQVASAVDAGLVEHDPADRLKARVQLDIAAELGPLGLDGNAIVDLDRGGREAELVADTGGGKTNRADDRRVFTDDHVADLASLRWALIAGASWSAVAGGRCRAWLGRQHDEVSWPARPGEKSPRW